MPMSVCVNVNGVDQQYLFGRKQTHVSECRLKGLVGAASTKRRCDMTFEENMIGKWFYR